MEMEPRVWILLVGHLIGFGTSHDIQNLLKSQYKINGQLQSLGYSPKCIAQALSECSDETFMEKFIQFEEKQTQILNELLEPNVNSDRQGKETSNSTPQNFPRDCAEIQKAGDQTSGIKVIYPKRPYKSAVKVYCELEEYGGGWTVIQRRMVATERINFNRDWHDYVIGFGNLEKEHWLGLENMHDLTKNEEMTLRIDLEDWEGETRYATYSKFEIGSPADRYRLLLTGFTGNLTDDFSHHNGQYFSTSDNDNSADSKNCAEKYKGGGWYNDCHKVHLNGLAHRGKHANFANGIHWQSWKGYRYSLKRTRMMIRPTLFR